MKDLIGTIFLILGYGTIIFGSIGIFAYGLYDIIHNIDELTKTQLFLDILMMVFKEIIPAIIGLIFIGIGFLIKIK